MIVQDSFIWFVNISWCHLLENCWRDGEESIGLAQIIHWKIMKDTRRADNNKELAKILWEIWQMNSIELLYPGTDRNFSVFLSVRNRFKTSTNGFLESECLSQLSYIMWKQFIYTVIFGIKANGKELLILVSINYVENTTIFSFLLWEHNPY